MYVYAYINKYTYIILMILFNKCNVIHNINDNLLPRTSCLLRRVKYKTSVSTCSNYSQMAYTHVLGCARRDKC